MPYNNFGFNPYSMPNPYQQVQQTNGLTQVVGLEGAKAYQTPPNSTIPLFDSDNAIFYVKTTDSLGNSNVRVFDFQERKSNDKPDYVTQEEFNILNNKIDSLLEVINAKPTVPETQQSTANQPSDESVSTTAPTRRRKPSSSL